MVKRRFLSLRKTSMSTNMTRRQNSSPQTLTRPPTMWTSRKMRLKEKQRRNLTELMQLRQWRIFSKFRSHLLIFSNKWKKYKMISELIITHISIQWVKDPLLLHHEVGIKYSKERGRQKIWRESQIFGAGSIQKLPQVGNVKLGNGEVGPSALSGANRASFSWSLKNLPAAGARCSKSIQQLAVQRPQIH